MKNRCKKNPCCGDQFNCTERDNVAAVTDISDVMLAILAERLRQVTDEGWTPEHDDDCHAQGELAHAAACYANPIAIVIDGVGIEVGPPGPDTRPIGWPKKWNSEWWKPTNRRRDLVKAAALIIAEIERLDRIETKF